MTGLKVIDGTPTAISKYLEEREKISQPCRFCGSKLTECSCGELISISCSCCYSCGKKMESKT